ncbi:MAG: MBOAT family O-acyltransferase [Chloroflexota bacterium]
MNFNTALFLFLFLPFFLILYFFAQPRWRPYIGILASLLFYAWGSVPNLIGILVLLLINFWLGLRLDARPAKWILPLGLVVNVGVLFFFKYFVVYGLGQFSGLASLVPEDVNNWFGSLTFPLGLSYISFQLVSYLIDVQKKSVTAEKNLAAFAFYILMFPKLLVGPIIRYRTLADQLAAPVLDQQQIADGIRRFLRGFAKKMLIADVLAKTVNAVFDMPVNATTPGVAWLVLIGYALQIYYDFSGYTDMAIGLAAMMGLRFSENFNYPYIAQSIGDFWRRWHISLSTWFRDYVFYPLERRRLPVVGQSLNILIVFLLTGLWHGFGASFAIWGLLHGFFLVLEGLFLNRLLQKTFQPVRHIYTLTVILFTWLVFRAPSWDYLFGFLRLLAGSNPNPIQLAFADTSPLPFIEPSFIIAFVMGILLCIPIVPAIQKRFEKSLLFTIAVDLLLLALFLLSIGMMASSAFLPGIYQGF